MRWLAGLGAILATGAAIELGVRALVGVGVLTTPRPEPERRRFWDGRHPVFGVWHRPLASTRHDGGCFQVSYRTNAQGARDQERPERSEVPRVVMLGDSFVEGWGVERAARLSDRLEAATGIPHLNFGMAHFGPYQSFLVYRELASRYDHEAVLVGVVPHNDFTDLDYEKAKGSPAYRFRYRPYLRGSHPDYEHWDHRESGWQHFLRHRSYAYLAIDLALASGEDDYLARSYKNAQGQVRSDYYDYSDPQLDLLRTSLERIAVRAGERPVVVFLIPTHGDFVRARRSGPSPLPGQLAAHGREAGYRVVDLLPAMDAASAKEREYFFRCDYHWNVHGNQVAARILQETLEVDLYAGLERARTE